MKDHAAHTHESRLVDRSSLVGLHFLGEMESKTIKENMGEWRGVKGSLQKSDWGRSSVLYLLWKLLGAEQFGYSGRLRACCWLGSERIRKSPRAAPVEFS